MMLTVCRIPPCLIVLAGLVTGGRVADAAQPYSLQSGVSIQESANGVLALMGYSVVPDVTASALSINNASSGNPGLAMTQFGGGITWSNETRLYLEGAAAYSRYDPTFVASNGEESRAIPLKWTTVSGTAGIGWDFPIADHLVIRPIFNFSLGTVTSDLTIANWYLGQKTERQIEFLDKGSLNAYGLGASVMLDYEVAYDTHEIDVEARLTNIHLQTFGSTSEAVAGSANAITAGIWSRLRAPTPWTLMDRPLRYVLEGAYSNYMGDQRGALGFNALAQVGAGIEFDSSAYDIFVTRTRLVCRYVFGNDVSGTSVSVAMSF